METELDEQKEKLHGKIGELVKEGDWKAYVKEKIKLDDLVKERTLATVEDIRKEMAIAKKRPRTLPLMRMRWSESERPSTSYPTNPLLPLGQ